MCDIDRAGINGVRKQLFVEGKLGPCWMILGYNGKRIQVVAQGNTGVEDLVSRLGDDQVQYVLVRLPDKNEVIGADGEAVKTGKDIFIQWTGPKVKVMERGKKRTHAGEVETFMKPVHASLTAVSKDNFNAPTILQKSHPKSGSHVLD
eukprot:CAMPEP_0168529382 /NCGR_PEP_ID=MMETSP0405-20121227/13879_1 /TAXON_ID=498012 /ORGANISM="Trichosphaerium sp, Strain Am-I-7 wt" /LENGTH=147 /DNA_ID=CAMNT_0008553103 /DNA_START=82 /DNA_END=525 /DNA_ORIENTATION=+